MDTLSKKKFSNKYAALSMICFIGLYGFANQTEAGPSIPLFNCIPASTIQPPPTKPPGSVSVKSSFKRVCPTGQVPQPAIQVKNTIKGLPPEGALSENTLKFHYVGVWEYHTAVGLWARLSQNKPYLNPLDYHSLAELAAQSADGRQIVEIGWTVDRGVNHGDDHPHLFVFSWVNRIPNCYNGCGYVQVSPTIYPGMQIPSDGSQATFAIEYYQGNWWLYYNSEWFGYFPDSIWSNKGVIFNQTGLTQWFSEVATNTGTFTQMGNGIFGSLPGSASFHSTSLFLDANTSINASWNQAIVTDPSCYNYAFQQPGSTYTYGGPGCS
jgi:neprosin-like protein